MSRPPTLRPDRSRRRLSFAPQIQAVTAGTRLVTVTIGGNDDDYIGNLLALTCQDEPATAGGAYKQCGVKSSDQIEALFKTLPDDLTLVATAVHQRAPSAKLVFVSYLPVLPPTTGCPDKVPLGSADAYEFRLTLDRLETTIKKVAEQTGSLFVAAGALGMGREACSDVPYVANYDPPITPGWPYNHSLTTPLRPAWRPWRMPSTPYWTGDRGSAPPRSGHVSLLSIAVEDKIRIVPQ